jgi:amidase
MLLIDLYSLIMSESTSGPNSTYYNALRRYKEIAAFGGIDAVLQEFEADAIVMPAFGTTTVSGENVPYFTDSRSLLNQKQR